MKVSVVIPTFNSALTIEATLDSVLAQSAPPNEILIVDDGSTDNTINLLQRYKGQVTVLQESNQGVAHTRNVLCRRAQGEFVAFLDHDDVWHPEYLRTQQMLFQKYPNGVAFFTGHDNFYGYGDYDWNEAPQPSLTGVEVIAPLDFLQRYHKAPGPFVSMSLICIPKAVLNKLGPEPFCEKLNGVDDFHLLHRLLLLGPMVFDRTNLVAYRITSGAQSASLLKAVEKAVYALELLEPIYSTHRERPLKRAFGGAFSAQRREYGKVLMGAGRPDDARRQFGISLSHSFNPNSLMKSLALLFLTGVPNRYQPKWPSEWKTSHTLHDNS